VKWCDGRAGKALAMFIGVDLSGLKNLTSVAQVGGATGAFLNVTDRWDNDRCKNADDRDHREQFNEGKALLGVTKCFSHRGEEHEATCADPSLIQEETLPRKLSRAGWTTR